MSLLDLNNPLDFARATMGDVGSILQAFTSRDPREWNIFEASYNGVIFHVFESALPYSAGLDRVTDTGGRRKVKYMFPYKDGQTTDDLGRKPESIQMNVLIHGPQYLNALAALMREFDKPTPGDLIHPIRGEIRCVVEDWQLLHESNSRKAVAISVTFIEHNFTIGQFRTEVDASTKGALARALEIFQTIDAAILAVRGTILFANSIKQRVEALLNNFKDNSASTLRNLNRTFNGGGSSVDIPTLLPPNTGGVEVGGNFNTVISPSDKYAAIPVDQLQGTTIGDALAIEQLTKEINGLRTDIQEIIDEIENAPILGAGSSRANVGSLEFYDTILSLKNSAILLQDVLENGIASSKARILDYEVPRTMSIREVAFAVGLTPDDAVEIDLLNPSLLSTNLIPAGTMLKIPRE